ncbi:response regulator [Shewanella algae]|uniref:response regulator n=1 Tax=Shewanella algae TaxID=38313 RepID=UPI002935BA63|nr:response regulator [Shewanella algae]MDV2962476.1 response regulator [Shewanella algae]
MIKILIVEDDEIKQEDIKQVVLSTGIDRSAIITTDNVFDAKAHLSKEKFDLVILDLSLPIRKNETAVENGGKNLLYCYTNPQYLTPISTIVITGYESLKEKFSPKFMEMDMNIYDYNNTIWRQSLTNKIELHKRSLMAQDSRSINNKVCILVHGVLTDGEWQERILLPDEWKKISYKYNYYSALKILTPISRKKQVESFVTFFKNVIIDNPESEIVIVAHSFGTYLVCNALLHSNIENLSYVSKIILSGSVMRQDFSFSDIARRYKTTTIINDASVNDKALVLSKMFCFGLGHAGRVGFNTSHDSLTNRFHKGGHSLYKRERFIEDYWVDVIESGNVKVFDCRKSNKISLTMDYILAFLNPYIVWPAIASSLAIYIY